MDENSKGEPTAVTSLIVCHQLSDGQMKFQMNGELKELVFMYHSIGLHINKVIADQQEKLKQQGTQHEPAQVTEPLPEGQLQ